MCDIGFIVVFTASLIIAAAVGWVIGTVVFNVMCGKGK